MPIIDWECQACGARLLDQYHPRTDISPPSCPNEGKLHTFHGVPIRIQLGSDGRALPHLMLRLWTLGTRHKPFQGFSYDDGHQVHEVDSLGKVRALERASEARAAASPGAASPEIFRAYSQDPSNRDANVFGKPPQVKPITRTRRGVPFKIGRL